jgi:hypothetical protein
MARSLDIVRHEARSVPSFVQQCYRPQGAMLENSGATETVLRTDSTQPKQRNARQPSRDRRAQLSRSTALLSYLSHTIRSARSLT